MPREKEPTFNHCGTCMSRRYCTALEKCRQVLAEYRLARKSPEYFAEKYIMAMDPISEGEPKVFRIEKIDDEAIMISTSSDKPKGQVLWEQKFPAYFYDDVLDEPEVNTNTTSDRDIFLWMFIGFIGGLIAFGLGIVLIYLL